MHFILTKVIYAENAEMSKEWMRIKRVQCETERQEILLMYKDEG